MAHWKVILHLCLHHLDFLLVTGLKTLWNQVIWDKIRQRNISMIDLLSEVVDGLHQHFSLLSIRLELLFEFWSLQQFLFEVQLPIEIGSVIAQSTPNIIDTISEPFQFLSGNWQFFNDGMFEPFFLESYQILQFFNLFLSILKESHQKGFNLERLQQFIIIVIDLI